MFDESRCLSMSRVYISPKRFSEDDPARPRNNDQLIVPKGLWSRAVAMPHLVLLRCSLTWFA